MTTSELQKKYREYINSFEKRVRKLKSISRWYVVGKILTFLLFAYALYKTWDDLDTVAIWAVGALLTIYISLLVLDRKLCDEIDLLEKKITICKREQKTFMGDFSSFRTGEKFIDSGHEFTLDLDIFGKSSLFNRLNRTITANGEMALADRLKNLSQDEKEITQNAIAINELKDMIDWKLDFLANGFIENHEFGKSTFGHSSYIIKSRFPYISIALTLALLFVGILGYISFVPFIFMFLSQLLLGMWFSKKLSSSSIQADLLKKEFHEYTVILQLIFKQEFKSAKILEIKKHLFGKKQNSLKAFQQLARIINLADQRSSPILYILVNGFFLFDLVLLKRLHKWHKMYGKILNTWIDNIAELDALVSLSMYAYNNPHNQNAQILKGSDSILEAKDLYHPFLVHKDAVPNNFTIKKHSIAIITGANMAGKSTFLRTIGVNYILASCGVPVCAKSFKFFPVSLFSSMRTTDNLSEDISYFNAELIRIEKLIKHIKSQPHTLIILDEILKGTNSRDKLEGSRMFLKAIAQLNATGIIATHDLELSTLEDEHPNFQNYCFEIELSETIKYDYKIQRGIAKNMNASYLLSHIIDKLQ